MIILGKAKMNTSFIKTIQNKLMRVTQTSINIWWWLSIYSFKKKKKGRTAVKFELQINNEFFLV